MWQFCYIILFLEIPVLQNRFTKENRVARKLRGRNIRE